MSLPSAPPWQSLGDFLREHKLSKYESKLEDLGVADVTDLDEVEEGDLKEAGMKPLEIRRLLKAKSKSASPFTERMPANLGAQPQLGLPHMVVPPVMPPVMPQQYFYPTQTLPHQPQFSLPHQPSNSNIVINASGGSGGGGSGGGGSGGTASSDGGKKGGSGHIENGVRIKAMFHSAKGPEWQQNVMKLVKSKAMVTIGINSAVEALHEKLTETFKTKNLKDLQRDYQKMVHNQDFMNNGVPCDSHGRPVDERGQAVIGIKSAKVTSLTTPDGYDMESEGTLAQFFGTGELECVVKAEVDLDPVYKVKFEAIFHSAKGPEWQQNVMKLVKSKAMVTIDINSAVEALHEKLTESFMTNNLQDLQRDYQKMVQNQDFKNNGVPCDPHGRPVNGRNKRGDLAIIIGIKSAKITSLTTPDGNDMESKGTLAQFFGSGELERVVKAEVDLEPLCEVKKQEEKCCCTIM